MDVDKRRNTFGLQYWTPYGQKIASLMCHCSCEDGVLTVLAILFVLSPRQMRLSVLCPPSAWRMTWSRPNLGALSGETVGATEAKYLRNNPERIN